jgi:hypothetical protein
LPSRVRLAASWRLRVAVRAPLRKPPVAAGERRRRGLCRALGCTRSARSRRRARSSTVSSTASASRCAASTRWCLSTRPQRLATQRNRVAHARPGLLRARFVATALRERLSRRQRAVCRLAQLLVQRADVCHSLAVWYRVSPGETALPFHRKRPAYEAANKERLKHCGGELDPKSRTLRLPLGRGRAAEWRWRRALTLCSCDRAS